MKDISGKISFKDLSLDNNLFFSDTFLGKKPKKEKPCGLPPE